MREFEDWTRTQKLRWFFGWIIGVVIFSVTGLVLHSFMQSRYPNLEPQLVVAIGASVSLFVAAVLGALFYRVVIVTIFPDSNSTE